MKIIVCERCFNIPKLLILNKNEIQFDCSICNLTYKKEISYFNRFININENDNLFELPRCDYKRNHLSRAISYCFNCSKYLCRECLDSHNEIFQGREHTTINQKIQHQYFCKKPGHEENILNRFCFTCNNYLCCDCNCGHNNSNKYCFENIENKINEIKNSILKCENIIQIEENYLNKFINKITNKINVLRNLFNDYKRRNTDLISFYKLLINNFEQIRNIKNYNIRNNILLNNNFYLKESKISSYDCLIGNYNRLSEFYRNTNHIKTKEFADHFTTTKYCNEQIKKCVVLNENIIMFIFEGNWNNSIYFTYKYNNNSEYKIMNIHWNNYIRDIYYLNDNKYIFIDISNNLKICNISFDDKNSLQSSSLLDISNIQIINFLF